MANFLDKLKIKTAVENTTKLDLSCTHITTANFMQANVAWCKELVPKEKISVNMETFTRLNPMPVPTFGRANINNRAFFVPYRTIMSKWNDFITDSPVSNADGSFGVSQVPVVSNESLLAYIFYVDNGFSVEVTGDVAFDIAVYRNGEDTIKNYKYTAKGRQFVKILESLGYKIIPSDLDSTVFSALPLLAYCKVMIDWYWPSAYMSNSAVGRMERYFTSEAPGQLTSVDLSAITDIILNVNYDSDYFVSAWDNPVAPTMDAYSPMSISDITLDASWSNAVDNTTLGNGTPSVDTGSSPLTQFAVDALKSLTDYLKRHQLVGARALDRYLARFGVNLSAEKMKRSVYIGAGHELIQFGDIMSTADTTGASLGDYAGKGIGYGTSSFDFSTDEYGIMIVVSSIVPKVGYYQGIDRNVMHINRTDFWTPEFDNLGTQAISRAELYVPTTGTNSNYTSDSSYFDNGVFGWTPRYAEYKVGRDKLTGDFRYGSINTGTEAWHLMREVEFESPSDIVHSEAFVRGTDANQYSRIFYNTDADVADKFNVIYDFSVASWSPMKTLFDTYEFDSKGGSVTEQVNGVKMN